MQTFRLALTGDLLDIDGNADRQGLGLDKLDALPYIDYHFMRDLAPSLAPGTLLFALHAADGTPILLTDSREAAVANAWSHELETVSVH